MEKREETINEIMAHLDGIIDTVDRMCSGNFMHSKNSIKLSAKIIKNRLKELGLDASEP
jgi:hypothetical protein